MVRYSKLTNDPVIRAQDHDDNSSDPLMRDSRDVNDRTAEDDVFSVEDDGLEDSGHSNDDRSQQTNPGDNQEASSGIIGHIREGNSSQQISQNSRASQEIVSDSEQNDNAIDLEHQGSKKLSPKQRIINTLNQFVNIKQTYDRINNGLTTGRMQPNIPGRFIGQGTDGVFRNLMAKPETESNRVEQERFPPTYEEAASDAAPEYWESTMVSPMYEDEVFVEGLPVGNLANFIWNGLVTVAFQFVGFVLCYLLHTSHAAKEGSRAGLGLTFVLYGYGIIPSNMGQSKTTPARYEIEDPNSYDVGKWSSIKGKKVDTYRSEKFIQNADASLQAHKTPYLAYGIIAFGIFIVLKSVIDFYKVKQIEKSILAPTASEVSHESHTAQASSSSGSSDTESND